jgi:predicted short-subunit dehydrogenase-like oxidoreductase (DUF2520 family)
MAARTLPKSAPRNPSVAILGLGNWGLSLARALTTSGTPPVEIVRRTPGRRPAGISASVPVRSWKRAALEADVLWLCVPDARIAPSAERLARQLAARPHSALPCVFHSSGALDSSQLESLRALGCAVAAVHPLMTFPPSARRRANVSLAGVPFAVEGDRLAQRVAFRLVRCLGGDPFLLDAPRKALYHAFGALASPMLVSLLHATVQAGAATGASPAEARRRMRPIVERTVSNFFAEGAAASFSGPIARGDHATIHRHLQALGGDPDLLGVYRALALHATRHLPARNRSALTRLLG